MAFVRRVITGHDAERRPVILDDAVPPKTIESPTASVSELLVFSGPPAGADAGGDSSDPGFPLHPEVGGATVRMIRLAPPPPGVDPDRRWLAVPSAPPERPGWHTTDTLDFEVILDGEIVLDLDDGEHRLGPGDLVVQRGTGHRWRVVGDRPCTYFVVMIRPDPAARQPEDTLSPRRGEGPGPRRLVTSGDVEGRSYAALDGPAAVVSRPAGAEGVALSDVWQTGGALRSVEQGGDADNWQLEPLGRGISLRTVDLPAGHDPGDAGWHATDTIDVDVILSGRMELSLPEIPPVILDAGDVVVQRATNHRWRPVGNAPVRMAAVMFGLPGEISDGEHA